jgi:hypothetical protein
MIIPPMPVVRVLVALVLGAVLPVWAQADAELPFTPPSPEAAGIGLDPMARHYELGHGLRLGDSGFTLGGYGDLSFQETNDERDWTLGLEALSGFLWWDGGNRWRFFAELELTDALVFSPGDTTTDEARVVLERLYFDYVLRDEAKFRVGKFLTPVGRWNLIHAEPLVWTTSRPLITETTFPTNATGAMVYGVLPFGREGIEYSVYASPGEELFPAPDADTFREAYGGHLKFTPWAHTQIGLSFVDFELAGSAANRRKLYGVDLFWSWRRFEFSGEYAYRSATRKLGGGDERGYYAQFVAPLWRQLYGVARYENFRESDAPRDLHLYVGGLNYRWNSAIALKAEYSRATDDVLGIADGFKASIAVLF